MKEEKEEGRRHEREREVGMGSLRWQLAPFDSSRGLCRAGCPGPWVRRWSKCPRFLGDSSKCEVKGRGGEREERCGISGGNG